MRINKATRTQFIKNIVPRLSNQIVDFIDMTDKLPVDPGKLFDYAIKTSKDWNKFALYIPDVMASFEYGEDLSDEDIADARKKFCKNTKEQRKLREVIRLNKFIKLMNVVAAEAICKQDNNFGVGDTATDEGITSDFYQNLHR